MRILRKRWQQVSNETNSTPDANSTPLSAPESFFSVPKEPGSHAIPGLGSVILTTLAAHDGSVESYTGRHRSIVYAQVGLVARTLIELDEGYHELIVTKQPGTQHKPVATAQPVAVEVEKDKIVPLIRNGVPQPLPNAEVALVMMINVADESQSALLRSLLPATPAER